MSDQSETDLSEEEYRIRAVKDEEFRQLGQDCHVLRQELRDAIKSKVRELSEAIQQWDMELAELAVLKEVVDKLGQEL
jgi:hypothetical protein